VIAQMSVTVIRPSVALPLVTRTRAEGLVPRCRKCRSTRLRCCYKADVDPPEVTSGGRRAERCPGLAVSVSAHA
jgi:hypothetical protein